MFQATGTTRGDADRNRPPVVRLAPLVAVTAALVTALTGCTGTPEPTAGATPTGDAATVATASAGTPAPTGPGGEGPASSAGGGTATGGGSPGSARPCQASKLEVGAELGGVKGTLERTIVSLANNGDTCVLRGYPTIKAHPVGQEAESVPVRPQGPGSPPVVTVKPGQTAWFVFEIDTQPRSGNEGPSCDPAAAVLQITPPGDSDYVLLKGRDFMICGGKDMKVWPLQARHP